jgi:hypothetical protein
MAPAARLARFRREFAAELAAMPATTRLLLISAEQMGGLLDTEALIASLRDLLAPHVGGVRVVMYLRRQDSHYASGYTQALRVGQVGPPVLPKAGPEKRPDYDYATLLDRWARVFGEAAIVPRVFERDSLKNGDVVDDFLALCGLALEVPKDDPDRQSNLSLTAGGIDLVRAMAAHLGAAMDGGSVRWRRFVQAANEALPGAGWRPGAAEASAFLARYAEVNEAVRQRWFPQRERLFAPVKADAGAAARSPAVDAAAALDAACALILKETDAAMSREAQLHTQIARLRERAGDKDAARAAWRAAVRCEPTHAQAQCRLAELALETGDRASAEAHLAVLRAAHPGHALTERVGRLVGKAAIGKDHMA